MICRAGDKNAVGDAESFVPNQCESRRIGDVAREVYGDLCAFHERYGVQRAMREQTPTVCVRWGCELVANWSKVVMNEMLDRQQ